MIVFHYFYKKAFSCEVCAYPRAHQLASHPTPPPVNKTNGYKILCFVSRPYGLD